MKALPFMKKLRNAVLLFTLVACSEVDILTPLTYQNARRGITSFEAQLRFTSPQNKNAQALDGATLKAGGGYRIFTDLAAVRWDGQQPFKCLFWLDSVQTNRENVTPYDFKLSSDAKGLDVFGAGQYTIKIRCYYGTQENITHQQEDQVTFTVVEDPTPDSKDILWKADHETGDLTQWYKIFEKDGKNYGSGGEFNSPEKNNTDDTFWFSGASRDVARKGQFSAKLQLFDIQKALETPGVRLFRWGEPRSQDELYYSVWYYFPERYQIEQWWNVLQFKSSVAGTNKNDPFFILNVGNRNNGDMYFYLYNGYQKTSYQQRLTDIPVGQWFQVEVYHRSRGDNTGAITVWQDGVELFDVQGVQTRYLEGDIQWSINNYTDNIRADTVTLYVDDAVISQTRVGSDG